MAGRRLGTLFRQATSSTRGSKVSLRGTLRTKFLWTLHASKIVGVERPEHWVVTTSSIARHRRDRIRTQRVRSSLEAAPCHQTLNPTYTFFDSNRDTAYSELEAHEAYHKADIFKVTETGLSPDRLLPPEYSTMP